MRFIRRAAPALTLAFSLLGTGCLVVAQATPALAQVAAHPYTNKVNNRFATVSNGPQSALIVDVPTRATSAEQETLVQRVIRRDWEVKSRLLASQITRLEQSGLLKSTDVIPLSQRIVLRKQGRIATPQIKRGTTRAVGNGTLTFRFTGFDPTQAELLRGFVEVAYPRIEARYGTPAASAEIEVINAQQLGGTTIPLTRRLALGTYVYDPNNPTQSKIYLPLFEDPRGALNGLLLNMIHAFHGPAQFQYDAWEDGFARATAAVVLRDPAFKQYGITDPSANFLYSLMQRYDLLNQVPLGNNTYFPASQQDDEIGSGFAIGKMLFGRLGMGGAAWLKVYIENPNFFRQFNEAYYQQFDPNTNRDIAGNIPQLRALAGTLLPQGVEGLSWDDWYTRQYILDTSISPGTKLYAYAFPEPRTSSGGSVRQRTTVQLVYYRTEKSGDETALNGVGYGNYKDSSNAPLFLGAASERTVLTDGEGALTVVTTNSPGVDATRLTMDFSVENNVARVYLPVGFDGDFQGALLLTGGAKTVSVAQETVPTGTRQASGDVENGGFGVNLASADADLGKVTVTVSDGANTRTFRFNTGDGTYYAILRDGIQGGGVVTRSRTFATADGIAGNVPYLVSLPLQPVSPNASQALALPGTEFLLSYWNPARSTYETFQPDQPSVAPLQMGRGYWLKLIPAGGAASSTVSITGTAPVTDTDYTIACAYGWNLIGSPFTPTVELNTVYVRSAQGNLLPWQDAVEQNLVAAEPYRWDHDTRQYVAATALRGEEWEGYWVRVLTPNGAVLMLPGPNAPTRSRQVTRALVPTASRSARPDWSLRLRAAQTNSVLAAGPQATTVTLGAAKNATRAFDPYLDKELPPSILPSLDMQLVGGDLKKAGGRYVADFRDTASANRGTWNVQVSTPVAGPVTLTWDGANGLPRTTGLVLVDSTSGERVALRSQSHYTFTAQAGATRSFQIVAESALSLPLSINNVTMVPTRGPSGTSMNIGYSVTRAADVTMQITTLTGRSVRTLGRSRAAMAGQQRMVWDGRAQDGSSLPPGPYTVTLSARGDNGETTTVQRIVTLLN